MLPRVLLGVFLVMSQSAGADERADFLAAESALAQSDIARFEHVSARLTAYPLYPYLRFAAINRDLGAASDAQIERFLDDFSHTPLAERLRPAYLRRLAAAGRWSDYARVYRPDGSVERQCLYLRALIETGREAASVSEVDSLWLSGRSRPSACDPVFARWRASGRLTTALVWKRIRLAMDAGQPGLVRYLRGWLPEGEQLWVDRWLELDRSPVRVSELAEMREPHPARAAVLAHGIIRLAGRDPRAAAALFPRLRGQLAEDPAVMVRASAALGRALSGIGDRLGLRYWDAVPVEVSTLPEQERRLRAAIGLGAWDWVAQWVARMPDGMRKRDRWLYWQGRAEEQLGQHEAARASFERAAEQRSLWGFMAAERIDRPYRLAHGATPAEPRRILQFVRSPAFRRIRELHRLGRETDIRREWRVATRDMDMPDLLAAAYVADAFRWHDQAIFTLARAGYWDDLELRFPLEYREPVMEQAWQMALDPAWIFGVLRQESVFARTVGSPAGALGLMQLMPATAAEVAAEQGLPPPSREDLYDPTLNITLGAAYLARMRDRFGHAALATAAYNAGPRRVRQWLPARCTPADLWIAAIPFEETRAYVERVLTYRVIYASRLGMGSVRLSDLLPPVPGASFFEKRASGSPRLGHGMINRGLIDSIDDTHTLRLSGLFHAPHS